MQCVVFFNRKAVVILIIWHVHKSVRKPYPERRNLCPRLLIPLLVVTAALHQIQALRGDLIILLFMLLSVTISISNPRGHGLT